MNATRGIPTMNNAARRLGLAIRANPMLALLPLFSTAMTALFTWAFPLLPLEAHRALSQVLGADWLDGVVLFVWLMSAWAWNVAWAFPPLSWQARNPENV